MQLLLSCQLSNLTTNSRSALFGANTEHNDKTMDIDIDAILTKLLEVRGGKPGKNVDLTEAEIRGLIMKAKGIFAK